MKIGRNKPCPCGSGKKYKHCHGGHGASSLTSEMFGARSQNLRVPFMAKEHIRQKQQGLGRPIIATKISDHQIVAIGSTLMFSKNWRTFADFLSHYMKSKLTSEWGNAELSKPLPNRHVIMQWYDEICRIQRESISEKAAVSTVELNGVIACYYGLAYALYLIEHNVELQSRMLARLRDRSNFQGAYYELLVARLLITAGFELILEDEVDRGSQHCEFAAISKETKKRYSVEAKMRAVSGLLGKNETDGTGLKTAENPISHLASHLHAALRKPSDNQRMIFIDLNAEMNWGDKKNPIPPIVEIVQKRLKRYEDNQLEVDKSAYVFVTNMTFHRDLLTYPKLIGIPIGLGIPDFNRNGSYRLSEIYRRDVKHADALRVGRSIQDMLIFPTTFDGSLPSANFSAGSPPVQIGQSYVFEGVGVDGGNITGEVTEAIVDEATSEAIIAIYTRDKQAHILKQSMTIGQLEEYKAYGRAYFGGIEQNKKISSPYDMFMFFLNVQRGLTRMELIAHLKISDETSASMSDEDLLVEYCERLVIGSGMFKVVDGVLSVPHHLK